LEGVRSINGGAGRAQSFAPGATCLEKDPVWEDAGVEGDGSGVALASADLTLEANRTTAAAGVLHGILECVVAPRGVDPGHDVVDPGIIEDRSAAR
jgi:hypothetical protein